MEDGKDRGMMLASHEIKRHTEKEASTVSIKLLHLPFKALFFAPPIAPQQNQRMLRMASSPSPTRKGYQV